MALVLLTLTPLVAPAQQVAADISFLRNKATADGSIEVAVTTRAVADARASKSGPLAVDQQRAIGRAQQKIMLILVSRGLVVGNEVSLQPDGSLVLRVLPQGLDFLAQSTDVQEIRANADASRTLR
jgi:hypothetical protein